MAISSDAYDASVLDQGMLLALAKETADLAYGRVPTQSVGASEFWELGRVRGDRSRRAQRSRAGAFEFWGNSDGDLVGLKPDGRLVEVRYTQNAGSSNGPPPLELGAFETRWEEGPFEKDWHFEILDSANLGLPTEEVRTADGSVVHEELWSKSYVTIVEQRGRGLERALQDLQAMAQRAIESGETVPSGPMEPRSDGVYECLEGESSRFVRFYEGGRVVALSTPGTAEAIRRFDWDRVELPQGRYSTTANHIEFVTMTSSGAVRYKGSLQSPARMELDSYSHINGNVSRGGVFDFVEVEFDPVTTDAPVAGSSYADSPRAGQRPTTWEELLDHLQNTYPLDPGHSSWPSIKFTVEGGRSQWVVVRPRGAPERGRVELITGFAQFSPTTAERILERIYDLAFGGVVKIGDDLFFRDTFRLGTLDMEEFHDLIGFVAGIGDILEEERSEGDVY